MKKSTRQRPPSGTPGSKRTGPTAPDWKTQQKAARVASKPNLKGEPPNAVGTSRLDAIYAQLKNLQSFKDEIMGDLEEFMDDVESKSGVAIPE